MANRRAPAWAEWPLPSTLPSTSNRPSMPTKCRGNISCSLRHREKEWKVYIYSVRRMKNVFLSAGLLRLSTSVWMTLLQIPCEHSIIVFRQSDNPATVRTIERTWCKRVCFSMCALAGSAHSADTEQHSLLLQLGLCEADGVIRAGSRPHADSAKSPAHSSV